MGATGVFLDFGGEVCEEVDEGGFLGLEDWDDDISGGYEAAG